jgi:hypothetical protein
LLQRCPWPVAACSPPVSLLTHADQKTMKAEYENALILIVEKKISG